MPEALSAIVEFITIGLASGAIGNFILHTDFSISVVALAGLVGVCIASLLPFRWGPVLFGHCILTCVVGSMIALLAFWCMRLFRRVLS